MRVPSKQKQKLANSLSFSHAAEQFLESAFRIAKNYYQKFVLDFKSINTELGKSRIKGKYAKSTLSYVRDKILNCPIVKIVRKLGAYVYEISFLPFDSVQKNEQSDEKMNADNVVVNDQNAEPENDTELLSEDTGIDQQQLIKVSKELNQVGVKYDSHDLPIIAAYGLDAVRKSIWLFEQSRLTNRITNPEGWIRACLTRGWYLRMKHHETDDCFWMLDKLSDFADLCVATLGTIPSNVLDRMRQLKNLGVYPPPNPDLRKKQKNLESSPRGKNSNSINEKTDLYMNQSMSLL